VRVQDALRLAGGAARVAERGGAALVDVGELVPLVAVRDELLVVERAVAGAVGVRHQDLVADAVEARHDVGERGVEEDHLVLRVADDVAQVVLEQADIQRVQHGPHRRDREVQLEVAARVPAERGDAVARADAQRLERRRDPAGAAHHLAVRRALHAVVRAADDLAVSEEPLDAPRDVADEQGPIHHEAVHDANIPAADGR
jgi:hypothetical protein